MQTDESGRRWIFRLNLLLSALAIPAVKWFMPLRIVEGSKMAKLKAIDFTGAGMVLLSITLITVRVLHAS